MEFTHLHVHSHYSLLDGGNRIEDLVRQAAEHGMKSIAVTDHGNLYGAVEFYLAAREAGIKPILGMEAYISPTTRQDRTSRRISDASYHLLLLAQNETGWRNLMRLSSRAFLEGFYYRPRVDRELLSELNEGILCTSACLGGEVPSALVKGQEKRARAIAGEYRDIFGPDRFFIELQNQGEEDQTRVNPMLLAIARDLGVGVVGTNDVHFLRRGNKPSHDVLTCISTGKVLTDPDVLHYSEELYLKSPAEMEQALREWPEAIRNTLRIAERCHVELDLSTKHLPVFHAPDGASPDDYLARLAREGLERRFEGGEVPGTYRDRLDWELQVIRDKGYSSYFLIVHDFVSYARRNEIPAAPRGSGVATLLGYTLGIADVDPIRYGLLFERFTDPQRQEDPDIDIDMCQDGREQVIRYVREKYGHVAQIITYGTLKARAAIRDVGRVLNVPLAEVDQIAKRVPEDPKMTLDRALAEDQDFRRMYEDPERPHVRTLIDHARNLEGLARHSGVHAAGVVVCDEPLEELIPLCRQADSPEIITQWDGPTCEKVGMMKMDFLGLRTLTIIQRAREIVRTRTGKDIDPEQLPLDDPRVFEMFQNGETDGVFQFESEGMKGVLKQMQPNRIEDLIAANAMYRPGPMRLISDYCARKRGEQAVPAVHRLVDGILAETYGIMCYQEQVMQVLNRLGNLPLNRALTLIKAISKKKAKVIAAERESFLSGAQANGIGAEEAERLFELILRFAGYGFNKAHSTRYAIVAYQTAYFKVYHPQAFFAATLTYECGDRDKVVQYMAEAQRMGVKVAPPDINACDAHFTVDGEQVRFGLQAVKGVGSAAVSAIVTARGEGGPFKDLFDFCRRVDLRAVNRSTIEALVKCGALDTIGPHRAAMAAALDGAVQAGQQAALDRQRGQLSFIGGGGAVEVPATCPDCEPWSRDDLLTAEKEMLGFYVTAHPLERYASELRGMNWPAGIHLGKIAQVREGTTIGLGCMVTQVRPILTKKGRSAGKRMAILTVEDLFGRCEAVLFAEDFERCGAVVTPDRMVYLVATVDRRRERDNLIVQDVRPLEKAYEQASESLLLRIGDEDAGSEERLRALGEVLKRHAGDCPVKLQIRPPDGACRYYVMEAGRAWRVKPDPECVTRLRDFVGANNLSFEPKAPRPRENRYRSRRPEPAATYG